MRKLLLMVGGAALVALAALADGVTKVTVVNKGFPGRNSRNALNKPRVRNSLSGSSSRAR